MSGDLGARLTANRDAMQAVAVAAARTELEAAALQAAEVKATEVAQAIAQVVDERIAQIVADNQLIDNSAPNAAAQAVMQTLNPDPEAQA